MGERSAADLADVDEPAWPGIVRAVQAANVAVEVLGVDRPRGLRVLEALQVTARSPLGALALSCGGLLVDSGWLRLFGGGSTELVDLATANGLPEPDASATTPDRLHVGVDVIGGRFAVDGGGLGVAAGEVCYWGPDTLRWSGLGGGYGDFLWWVLDGGLEEIAAHLRWPGWQAEVQAVRPAEGLSVYPPPFTVEGRDLATTTRRRVPMAELTGFFDDAAAQRGE